MKAIKAISISAGAYLVGSFALFGDNSPIGFVVFAPSARLGLPYWKEIGAFIVILVGLATMVRIDDHPVPFVVRLSVFAVISLLAPTLLVGLYADLTRSDLIQRFDANHLIEHSFFVSIREPPRNGAQFYLHAAALKNCVPYAWSYRDMAFYQLRPGVAINVLPPGWVDMCKLRASSKSG